jgi:hypothetical protein
VLGIDFPIVDLANPTKLAFEWGWLLMTRANFIVYVLAILVFVLGATVRLPGVRKDIAAAERRNREARDR